jgi:beta-glucosidase
MESIEKTLKKLRTEEKILLVMGADSWRTAAIKRLNIPSIKMADGPHGARVVPDGMMEENINMPATCFPTASAMGATWNPELMKEVAAAMAVEMDERGVDILLGPGVNIQRLPHCGRNFEYFTEDPYLSARMGVSYIHGVQEQGISACLKHYAANNQEYERMSISAEIDERTLREIYLPAFEACVREGKVWMVMCAYNRINGTYASEHQKLLKEILREEWGFDGVIVSDWGAVYNRVPTANAGLDLEMPGPGASGPKEWQQAIKKKWVSKKELDNKVRRILTLVKKVNAVDIPRKIIPSADLQNPKHAELARRATSEAITLLKNEDQFLPIRPEKIKNLLIVGPNAVDLAYQGSGSSQVNPFSVVQPLDAIKEQLGDKVKITYAQGCVNTLFIPPLVCNSEIKNGDGKGHGLDAVFYPEPDFSGTPILERRDSILSFRDDDLKTSELQGKNFSARWQGTIVPKISGEYTFGLQSSGLSRLWIDGELIIDNWSDQLPNLNIIENWISGEKRNTHHFEAGQEYMIMLEYSKNNQPSPVLALGMRPPMKDKLLNEAIEAAKKADAIIAFAGYANGFEAEGFDRSSLRVPEDTEILLNKIVEINANTAVVVQNGAPLILGPWIDKAKAVIENWFAGQESGNAIVDVLTGKVNPSGKLAVTFPKRYKDSPGTLRYPGDKEKAFYNEGVFVGYRYFDKQDLEPQFPFGHGLSYTTFTYKNLSCKVNSQAEKATLDITFALTNSGDLAGKEIVQCYIGTPGKAVVRPPKELKAFQKLELAAGETIQIDFSIPLSDLAYFDVDEEAWITETGLYQVYIGASSRDIRLTDTIIIQNEIIRYVGDPSKRAAKQKFSLDSRLMDVLSDPRGEKILRDRFGEALEHPQAKLVMRLTLKNIIQMAGDLIPEEAIKGLEKELRDIK